jgi:hypothetical protein
MGVFLMKSLYSLFLAASLCSPVLVYAGPSGPKPSSQPVLDSFDTLQETKARVATSAEKAELSFLWLLDNPTHPKAAEVKQEILLQMEQAKIVEASGEGKESIFLAQMLLLFDTTNTPNRLAAIENLSQSGDSRAIVPLIYALRDPSIEVRESVAKGLGSFIDVRVEASLAAVLKASGENEKVRMAAAVSLGKQKTPSAGDSLLAVFLEEDSPKNIREASRLALLENFPDKISSDDVALDRRGRWLLIPVSGAFGGYALATAGILGQNDVGATIGGFGGTLLGASAAYFLTQKENMPLSQATYLTTGGAWGIGLGIGLGVAIDEKRQGPNSSELIAGLGLVGEISALTLTAVTRNKPSIVARTEIDHLEANVTGLLGLLAARGVNIARDDFFVTGIDPEFGFETQLPDFADEIVLSSVVSVGSLIGGEAIAPRLHFSRSDLGLMTLCGYEGGFYGGLSPFAFENGAFNEETVARSLLDLGIAGGIAGCGLLSQRIELPKKDLEEMFIADSFGKILGVGIPLLAASSDDRAYFGGTLIGGAVALTASTVFRDSIQLTSGDSVLTGFGSALGAWQGFALASALSKDGDLNEASIVGGGTLVGFSLGGLGSMALSQKLDLSPWEALWLSSGAFWGAWFSSFYTLLDDDVDPDLDDDFLFILGATDVGLGATIAMLSPKLHVNPTRIGIATLGGATGATVASLGMALFSLDGDKIIKANLVGSALGLIGGSLIASKYKVDSKPKKKVAHNLLPQLTPPQLTLAPLIPIDAKSAPPMAFVLRW